MSAGARRDPVVVPVVAGEPAAGVERTGRRVVLFHLEVEAGGALAGGGTGERCGDRGGQAGAPVPGVDLDRGQPAQPARRRPGRWRRCRRRAGCWRTPGTVPRAAAGARSAAASVPGSGSGRARPGRARAAVRLLRPDRCAPPRQSPRSSRPPGRTVRRQRRRPVEGCRPGGQRMGDGDHRRQAARGIPAAHRVAHRPAAGRIPTASALLALPVKPSAARSSHPPSGASSGARQPWAATASSSAMVTGMAMRMPAAPAIR